MVQPKISFVIPTRRENDESYLMKMAEKYPESPMIEYIIVDTETPEAFFDKLKRSDFNILRTKLQARSERLNAGLKASSSDFIVFHHPRSLLSADAIEHLCQHHRQLTWGGFTHRFDQNSLGLRFTSWYSNRVRPKLSGIVYLDHCLFFKKNLLTSEIPKVPIFEDTEISYLLRRSGPPQILPLESVTSAVRFERNGFCKQALKNQGLKLAYHLGVSRKKMNDFYEKRLNLN